MIPVVKGVKKEAVGMANVNAAVVQQQEQAKVKTVDLSIENGVYSVESVNGVYKPQTVNAEYFGKVVVNVAPKLYELTDVTPTAAGQTYIIPEGYDGLAGFAILGDANLIAENIKSGITIFGVEGTYTGG